jgi:hypothetical protein
MTNSRPKQTPILPEKQIEIITQNTLKALDKAPRVLIRWYEHPNPFRYKETMRRLLTDRRMTRTWQEIGKRMLKSPKIKHSKRLSKDSWRNSDLMAEQLMFVDRQYFHLWEAIVQALQKSATREPSRGTKREYFLCIAKNANRLARDIANGPLDQLTYEFFKDDDAFLAFKTRKWSVQECEARRRIAYRKLKHWPSLTDLLMAVEKAAQRHAREATTEPRIVDRVRQNQQANHFIRYLAVYFREHFKGPMLGSLANIASVVFNKPAADSFTKEFGKRALSH